MRVVEVFEALALEMSAVQNEKHDHGATERDAGRSHVSAESVEGERMDDDLRYTESYGEGLHSGRV